LRSAADATSQPQLGLRPFPGPDSYARLYLLSSNCTQIEPPRGVKVHAVPISQVGRGQCPGTTGLRRLWLSFYTVNISRSSAYQRWHVKQRLVASGTSETRPPSGSTVDTRQSITRGSLLTTSAARPAYMNTSVYLNDVTVCCVYTRVKEVERTLGGEIELRRRIET